MGIKSNLRNLLRASIKNNYTEDIKLSNINISKKHNIYTTDIAITIAQKLKKDPRLVAEKIATTENYKYITIDDIAGELRDGKKGISGIGANGKLKYE